MENTILKSEEKKTRSEIVEFLKEIAMKIDNGVVKLVQGEDSIELSIPDSLTLEIKVEEKIKHDPIIVTIHGIRKKPFSSFSSFSETSLC